MPLGGLLTGGGIGAVSGLLGLISSGNAADRAKAATDSAVQQYLSVNVPDPAEQKIILQRYQMTGEMDPRLAKTFQQASSGMNNIQTDPALKDAQMNALSSLQNEAENGGHTLAQDAYLDKTQQQVNAENAGRQGAIEEQFAGRGMGGPSGLMLSAEEQNNQNQTQKENEASLNAAAQAQNAALQALQSEGGLATQEQANDFNQKASVARAQDAINQFNTQMSQGAENENVAAENQANAYNVQEKQKISNQNADIANQEETHNKALPQQEFQDELQKAGGTAGAYENQAGQATQAGQQQSNMWGNIGQGGIKTGAAIAQMSAGPKKQSDDEDAW